MSVQRLPLSLVQAFDERADISQIEESKIDINYFVKYINALFDKGKLIINIFNDMQENEIIYIFNSLIFKSYCKLAQSSQNYYIKQLSTLNDPLFIELIGKDIYKLGLKQLLLISGKLHDILKKDGVVAAIHQKILYNIYQSYIKALNAMLFNKFQSVQTIFLDIANITYNNLQLQYQQKCPKIYALPSSTETIILNELFVLNYIYKQGKTLQDNAYLMSIDDNNSYNQSNISKLFNQVDQALKSLMENNFQELCLILSLPPYIEFLKLKETYNLIWSNKKQSVNFDGFLKQQTAAFKNFHLNAGFNRLFIAYIQLMNIQLQQKILQMNNTGIQMKLKLHSLDRENLPASLLHQFICLNQRLCDKMSHLAMQMLKSNIDSLDETFNIGDDSFNKALNPQYHHPINIPNEKLQQYIENTNNTEIKTIDQLQFLLIQKHIQVAFKNEHGIDGGGLRQELFPAVIEQLVTKESYQVFQKMENCFYIDPSPFELLGDENILNFQFFGACIGCCLIRSVSIPNYFPNIFNDTLLSINLPCYSDEQIEQYYAEIDPQLIEQLNKAYEAKIIEDINMKFTNTVKILGQLVAEPLGENMEDVAVTQENFNEYKRLLFRKRLYSDNIIQKMEHIRKGFYTVIDQSRVYLLETKTIKYFLYGDSLDRILEYLQSVVYCEPPYHTKSSQIIWLFEILREMSSQDFKNFLRFMYSQENIVVSTNQFKFRISPNNALGSFPVAHTCAQHLDLPQYTSKEILRQKLLFSIQHYSGFGLQ